MAHHFEPTLTGGFLGVDVFFVLSGYLITTLLVDEQLLRSDISLSRFYARRALRLLPALIPLFVVVAVCWALRPYPSAFGPIGSAIAAVAYVGNWVVATTSSGLGYLSHTWSLAIEEQFYVLWPIAFVWSIRRSSFARTGAWLTGFAVAIGLVRAAGWVVLGTTALLYVTPTRADGLLLGCGLALALRALPQLRLWRLAAAPAVGWISIGTLLALFVLIAEQESSAYLGGVSLAVLCAGALIAHLELAPLGRLVGLLASQPLPAIGRISYGLYLFHYPVAMLLYEPTGRTPLSFAAKLALSFALAITSYVVIERPALQLKRRFRADAPAVVATA
jgi:peptidoglycan/LPS O-acetylase OafA/YrhL